MRTVWQDIRAGARDARWSLYFLMVLLPATLAACLLAYVVEGKMSSPPSALTWALTAPAALVSLFVAGLLDGPQGRLGSKVWLLIVMVVILWLIQQAIRSEGGTHQATVGLLGTRFVVTLETTLVDVPREIWRSFSDFHVHWNLLDESSGRGVAAVH